MSLVRAHNISVSLDGFGAGADQSLEHLWARPSARRAGSPAPVHFTSWRASKAGAPASTTLSRAAGARGRERQPGRPPLPGKVEYQQAKKFAEAFLRGQPRKATIATTLFQDKIEQLKS